MKTRKDNKDMEIYNKSVKAAIIGILILCTGFYIAEILILHVQNYSWYSVIALYCAISYSYRAIKAPKKYTWFLAALWILATIACLLNYIIHRF